MRIGSLIEHVEVEFDAPIPTWYRVGGPARALAKPKNESELRECLLADPELRMLGGGANLIVDDEGVDELVVKLEGPEWTTPRIDPATGAVRAPAGCDLPRLVLDTVRAGLQGLEGLGGIPGVVGGATVMNAGGRFGEFADVVSHVHALDRQGERVTLTRDEAGFGYRTSKLDGLVVTSVDLQLATANPGSLRSKLKEVMAYKKASQPMAAHSAGCAFRNPRLEVEIPGLASPGDSVSAGLLLDRAGCKGLRRGGASVSERHANFITADAGARARDVIDLMSGAQMRVEAEFGIKLQREVVVWTRAS